MPTTRKIMLGNHTAAAADMLPLTEKDVDMVENKMYKALNAIPIPKFSPMPPRTLRDDSDTPIKVMINAANGEENLR